MARPKELPNSAHQAQYLGFVFSTTECGIAARSDRGFDEYTAVPMEARATWHGWPAHYLEHVPRMMASALRKLQKQGWSFRRPGYLSQAWRQHDLAILGTDDYPLIPAPSWECSGAIEETSILMKQAPRLVRAVGKIEPRFAAAKLPWALRMDPGLKSRIDRVMFSGDWVGGMLTGNWRLSVSDALCNGLLEQRTRSLAVAELRAANKVFGGRLNPGWFPEVIGSREVVGTVRVRRDGGWDAVTRELTGWKVVASLGDNQATAAGAGTADHGTIVISLGTSGTVNRPCAVEATLRGRALNFEYWDDRLLLLMLPACGAWYNLFRSACEPSRAFRELNELSCGAALTQLQRIRPPTTPGQLRDLQLLEGMSRAERVASIQCSIAVELLERTRTMLREVRKPVQPVERFILTGGLMRAPLVRRAIYQGLQQLVPGAMVVQNNRRGALAYKTDALGAIYNAAMAHTGQDVATLISRDSRHKACVGAGWPGQQDLDSFLANAIRAPGIR
jgi:sugar (pentulose or hexulose) kinase